MTILTPEGERVLKWKEPVAGEITLKVDGTTNETLVQQLIDFWFSPRLSTKLCEALNPTGSEITVTSNKKGRGPLIDRSKDIREPNNSQEGKTYPTQNTQPADTLPNDDTEEDPDLEDLDLNDNNNLGEFLVEWLHQLAAVLGHNTWAISAILETNSGVIEKHNVILNKHMHVLADSMNAMRAHTEALNRNTKALEEHTEALERRSGRY